MMKAWQVRESLRTCAEFSALFIWNAPPEFVVAMVLSAHLLD
jgi:hypothetical protein